MNVLIISECRKLSLQRTRRVIDLFIERIGRRTWCGNITLNGLSSMKNLLKKTASRGTAVSCFWIKKDGTRELLWIVGRCSAFGRNGVIPTDTTTVDDFITRNENKWKCAELVAGVTMLAGLLHDIGKSSVWFQKKLRGASVTKNRSDIFRHEVMSFLLFQEILIANNIATDQELLEFFSHLQSGQIKINDLFKSACDWLVGEDFSNGKHIDVLKQKCLFNRECKAFARVNKENDVIVLLSYLILSHHRLPYTQASHDGEFIYNFKQFLLNFSGEKNSLFWRENVKNELDETKKDLAELKDIFSFDLKRWKQNSQKKDFLFESDYYCNRLGKAARTIQKGLSTYSFHIKSDGKSLDIVEKNDGLVVMLSRSILMMADHYISAKNDRGEATVDKKNDPFILAKSSGAFTDIQLTSHCVSVAGMAYLFTRNFASLQTILPRIVENREFRKPITNSYFKWQNQALKKTEIMSKQIEESGFFGVNLASTGTGKTFANTKIILGCAGEHGCRFCFASGLRTLTLQSGQALKDRLRLDEDDIAVVLGDCLQGKKVEENPEEPNKYTKNYDEDFDKEIWDDNLYVDYDGQIVNDLYKFILEHDKRITQIVSAPVLVCTIDTLVNCFESYRGGKQIPAVLRLLSSDLIIDEIDDFSLDDLPAIARLIYFAGMFGSKVLISSATIPSNLVLHLYKAFSAGRALFNKANGIQKNSTILGIYDEFSSQVEMCALLNDCNATTTKESNGVDALAAQFNTYIDSFYKKRIQNLRVALLNEHKTIFEVSPCISQEEKIMSETQAIKLYANWIESEIYECHDLNSIELKNCANIKKISIGVVRFANINPLTKVAIELLSHPNRKNYALFGVIYHSRFPYLLRSYTEEQLDLLLNNRDSDNWEEQPLIKDVVKRSKGAENIIVVVMASPVEEVGRDHDFDWAVIEPSSIRSIIQMSGRVRRHRRGSVERTNVKILSRNFKSLISDPGKEIFVQPGFQKNWIRSEKLGVKANLLDMQVSFGAKTESYISSIPRIESFENLVKLNNLSAMEYVALEGVFARKPCEVSPYILQDKLPDITLFWTDIGCVSFDLQAQTRFRQSGFKQSFVRVCDEDENIYMSVPDTPDMKFNHKFSDLEQWGQKYHLDVAEAQNKLLINIHEVTIIRYLSQKYKIDEYNITIKYNKFEIPCFVRTNVQKLFFNECLGVWYEK